MALKKYLVFIFLILFFVKSISAAHFIVGYVNDARDGEVSNDKAVFLWNPLAGTSDNLTDVIGINGNSYTDRTYMIDCELLNNGCNIGDVLSVNVINNGDNYVSETVNVTVSGAGYDLVDNLTLNSPVKFQSIIVDDSILTPLGEIDLIAASFREVSCKAIVEELDGGAVLNISSRFFDNVNSGYDFVDDNNSHYTNNSCYLNTSYGNENESEIVCNFYLSYYSNPGQWNCTIHAYDDFQTLNVEDNLTNVNTLLSVGLVDEVSFGELGSGGISNEIVLNVTNYGNVLINLSLSGYGGQTNDGYAMNCSTGNIGIEYLKYNLTNSNPVIGDLLEFESKYENLTSNPRVRRFNLDFRKNDEASEAYNSTYWRIYLFPGIDGDCQGNIVFGAAIGEADI